MVGVGQHHLIDVHGLDPQLSELGPHRVHGVTDAGVDHRGFPPADDVYVAAEALADDECHPRQGFRVVS